MSNESTSIEDREKLKKEVELQKAIAEAERDIAKATQERLKAQIPSGEVKPLEGKITTNEKFGYIAELVAYHAMFAKADAIAAQISEKLSNNDKIMIVDSLDFCGEDVQVLQVSHQLDFWGNELQAQEKMNQEILEQKTMEREARLALLTPVAAAFTGAAGVLSAAAGIVGYFQVDYDIKGHDIKPSDFALRARVASRITKPVYLSHFHRITASTIIESLNQNIKTRMSLREGIGLLKIQLIDPLSSQIDTLKGEIQTLTAEIATLKSPEADPNIKEKTEAREEKKRLLGKSETKKTHAEAAYTRSETLVKEFDEFNKSITTVPEGKNHSLLGSVVIRKYLEKQGITHLLYITVPSGGGESITSRGLWTSGNTGFLGGGVITYALVDISGRIIIADATVGVGHLKYKLGQDAPPVLSSGQETIIAQVETTIARKLQPYEARLTKLEQSRAPTNTNSVSTTDKTSTGSNTEENS